MNESLNFTLATRIIFWLSIELFRSRNRCRMAACDTNLTFGPFDPDLDPTSVGTRFRKYLERFKVYAVAMNIKDKARKRALFLHCAGPKVQDIFDTLEDTGEDFETAGEKLLEYFEPRRHRLFSIYQFRQLAQEEQESYDDYATRLKQAAAPCEFPPDWLEVEIQMQLIEKGKSKRVRRRLLSKPHSLQEALDYARAQELSDKQAKRIEMEQQSRGNITEEELNRVSLRKQNNSTDINKECYFCGGTFPHVGGKKKCPAWGKKCTACGKMNHFAKRCMSKGKVNQSVVQTVHQEVHSDSSDAESLCGIEEVGSVESNPKPRPVRSIKIENSEIKVLIDTGASVNVMDECTFQQLLANKVKLQRSTSVLRSYQTNENPSRPLTVMGKFDAVVESATKIIPATFHVIKGNTDTEPLIGFQTAESLGLVMIANAVRTHPETFTSKLLEEYDDLFHGIGKMEGVKVDLHVDRAVTPVAQPHRRVPFSVRSKLEAELEKLLEDDVIEKVEEPTSWVSPVVITPKRTANEIRLNVDMREANKAIPRTHTIMPTLEDITHELNGAAVFSHLDMNHGYHQLELEENSRDVTTFSTHVGLYRYKRLNFGTRSAGEIFQDTVSREITQDIPGCLNISDDILVYGKNQQEHDLNLEKLSKKAREKKITFNKGKCEFNKKSCVYYGMKFSKDGASPDPRKVEAIKAAEPPRNAKELNSFLCTVQYNARFMEKYAPQTDLLRGLLKAKVFTWRREHQETFESLKEGLSSDTVLAYFDPAAEHEVHVDGCPLGISATLVQRESSDNSWRVVQYASRALSDAERNYSQIELEMLTADFACRKFHVFLYGLPFKIVTDHKPLEAILNNPRHKTSIRLKE